MRTYDALVIGAGPAGATTALLLARGGWSVAIAEKVAFPRRKVCGEYISATTWPVLRELGVASLLEAHAGPAVDRVGLFAGDTVTDAPMPLARGGTDARGRAIEREILDAALLERARLHGAEVLQPFAVEELRGTAGDFVAELRGADRSAATVRARRVIAAHGSWEHGTLPTQMRKHPARGADLFGFKAHYAASTLAKGLMPLVLFPGGYGGMVHAGRGRVSFSCCIRRDALAACRARHPGLGAGEAVIAHVMESCRGVRESLEGASLAGAWLASGPIRPGIRPRAHEGLFTVGNAAGEAHPLVAEGISMAIQSAWLLCESLLRAKNSAASDYPALWRRHFATRVRAASAFAAVTTSPLTAAASAAFMRRVPRLLTWGARWSGKAHVLTMDAA